MKRENNLIEKIAAPENLRLAFWKARKAKEGKIEVAEFRKSLDKNMLSLRNELLSGMYRLGSTTILPFTTQKNVKYVRQHFVSGFCTML